MNSIPNDEKERLEILNDKNMMQQLKESEEAIKKGEVRDFEDVKREILSSKETISRDELARFLHRESYRATLKVHPGMTLKTYVELDKDDREIIRLVADALLVKMNHLIDNNVEELEREREETIETLNLDANDILLIKLGSPESPPTSEEGKRALHAFTDTLSRSGFTNEVICVPYYYTLVQIHETMDKRDKK